MRIFAILNLFLALTSPRATAEDAKECDANSNGMMNSVTKKLDSLNEECESFVGKRDGLTSARACTHTDCAKISEEIGKHKDRVKDRNQFCNLITFNSNVNCSASTQQTVEECKTEVKQAIENVKEMLRKVMEEQDKSNGEIKAFMGKLKSERACLTRAARDEDARCGPGKPACGEEGRPASEAPDVRSAVASIGTLITAAQPVHSNGITLFTRDANGLGISVRTNENLMRDTQRLQSTSDSGPLNRNTPVNTPSTITGSPNSPVAASSPQPAAAASPAPSPAPAAPVAVGESGYSPRQDSKGQFELPGTVRNGERVATRIKGGALVGPRDDEKAPGRLDTNLYPKPGRGSPQNTAGSPANTTKNAADEAVAGFKNPASPGKMVLAGSEEKKVKGLLNELLGEASPAARKPAGEPSAPGDSSKAGDQAGAAVALAGGKKADSKGEKGEGSPVDEKKGAKVAEKDDPDSIIASAKEALNKIKAKYGLEADAENGNQTAAEAAASEESPLEMSSSTKERILKEMSLFERVRLAHLKCHATGCVFYNGY